MASRLARARRPRDPGWEAAHARWAAFREAVGEDAWLAWFADAKLSGAALMVPSTFAVEEIRARYGAQLVAWFGPGLAVKFGGAA